jgi:hypothetical protein
MSRLYVRVARWLIVPVVVAVGLIIGLSSGGGVPTVSPGAITQAADLTGHVAGADLSGTVSVDAAGRSVTLRMTGFESVARHDGVLTMQAADVPGLPSSAASFEMRFLYPVFYMRSELFARVLPAGKRWIRFNLAQMLRQRGISPTILSSAQSDPTQYLEYLKAISGRAQNLGSARIRGVLTTHYHAVSDLSRYAAAYPSSKRSAVRQSLAKLEQLTGARRIPMDVWVDSRHLIRRMRIDLSVGPTASIPQGLHEVVTIDLFNFGPKPAVTAPPTGQTEDLSSLLAGAP